jgi:hypothetical protein
MAVRGSGRLAFLKARNATTIAIPRLVIVAGQTPTPGVRRLADAARDG